MGVYLRAKFEVSRHWGNFTPLPRTHPRPPQKEPLKSPPRLGLNKASTMKRLEYSPLGSELTKANWYCRKTVQEIRQNFYF